MDFIGRLFLVYYVRPVRPEDIRQVSEIDREAFPENLPPPNYYREMKNGLAHYLVACDSEMIYQPPEPEMVPAERGKLLARVAQMLNLRRFIDTEPPLSGKEYVAGFGGIWVLADEAHLTNLAVRGDYQRRGLGELMLMGIIEMATSLGATFVTLEVQKSNYVAQNLYRHYGFSEVGVRRGYYIDNHEDALLMTTDKLSSADYQAEIFKLKQAYAKERGITLPVLKYNPQS
jgi:[ribosomal protein S18]-alanine N-acetyltransferase